MKTIISASIAFVIGLCISVLPSDQAQLVAPLSKVNQGNDPLVDTVLQQQAPGAVSLPENSRSPATIQPTVEPAFSTWQPYIQQSDWQSLLAQTAEQTEHSPALLELELALLEASQSEQLAFLQYALSLRELDDNTGRLLQNLMGQFTKDDPVIAATFFIGLQKDNKKRLADSFLHAYASATPMQAWQLLQDLASSEPDLISKRNLRDYRSSALYSLANNAATSSQAFSLLNSLEDSRDKQNLARSLGRRLGGLDLTGALDYASRLEDAKLQTDYLNAAISSSVSDSAEQAAQALLDNQDLATATGTGAVARGLLALDDRQTFENFYAELSNPALKDAVELEAAKISARAKDYSASLDWLIKIDDQKSKYQAINNSLGLLGQSEFSLQQHVGLIQQANLIDSNLYSRALNNTLNSWFRAEPSSVGEYVESLPEGELKTRWQRKLKRYSQ